MTPPPLALYLVTPASLCIRNQAPCQATLAMRWTAAMPLTLNLTIATDEHTEPWHVGRNVFIAAHEDWARGAWMGQGAFSICYAADQVMFGFKGTINGQTTGAVLITKADPVAEFIAHSTRLTPPSTDLEEAAVNLALDNALTDILGSDRD